MEFRPGSTMLKPVFRAALPAILLGACWLPLAHADIYTWTDDSGRMNLSNLTPPEGVKVTRVVHESAPKTAPRDEPARDALREAEVQVLAERVRQLQYEVELAKRPVPQQVEYRVVPPPPIIQYFSPPEAQYAAAAPPVYSGCDFGFDCGFGWGSGFYPANFVALTTMFVKLDGLGAGVTERVRGAARTVFRAGDGRPIVETWLVPGMGHAWSGGDPRGTHTDPAGPDATEDMLRFLVDE